MRILDKKLPSHVILAKNLVCWGVYISDNLTTLPILSATWKPDIQTVI